jgi:hypothetical protein
MRPATEQVAQVAADAAASSAAKANYVGGALSAVGGLALNSEVIALMGLTLAAMGWMTQLYFSRRRDRRDEEEHELKMQILKEQLK